MKINKIQNYTINNTILKNKTVKKSKNIETALAKSINNKKLAMALAGGLLLSAPASAAVKEYNKQAIQTPIEIQMLKSDSENSSVINKQQSTKVPLEIELLKKDCEKSSSKSEFIANFIGGIIFFFSLFGVSLLQKPVSDENNDNFKAMLDKVKKEEQNSKFS